MVTGIPFSPGKTSPRNSRLPSPIAVQVKEKKPTRSNRVEGRYLVADLNGKEFELKVWQKHGLNIEWDVDTWYVLREARGTVWESDGEVHRLLDMHEGSYGE